MLSRESTNQRPDQIIDVSSWHTHEEFEVFPVGARDKTLLVCPEDVDNDFCIPGHKYLFKEAFHRYPSQYWAEVIAFRIGKLMSIEVPPTFVAWNSKTKTPGALIEWFVGYDKNVDERYTPGGDFMQNIIPDFDREKGGLHNLETIIILCRALNQARLLQENWVNYWGLCLAFDTIIGNTDRHQENWGLLTFNVENKQQAKFSPYFDNGTSLGHENNSKQFAKFENHPEAFEAYIRRGTHHMKTTATGIRMNHAEFVYKYCQSYPAAKDIILESLNFSLTDLKDILGEFILFDIQAPFSEDRAKFVYKLAKYRKNQLVNILQGNM